MKKGLETIVKDTIRKGHLKIKNMPENLMYLSLLFQRHSKI